jgi:rRNA-processing protein FCF1
MESRDVFSSPKVAVSFSEECGIYVSNAGFSKAFHENDKLHIFDEGITIDQIKDKANQISPEREARGLISLFEDLVVGHHEFLSDYQFTSKLPYRGVGLRTYMPYECLQRLSNDFKLDNKSSSFAILYRELEDELIDLSFLSMHEPTRSSLKRKLDSKISILSKILEPYYNKAHFIIGLSDYFSIYSKPYEMAFGFSPPALPTLSHVSEDGERFVTINPFMLYWLLKDVFSVTDGYLKPRYLNLWFKDVSNIPDATLESLRLIVYVPSSRLFHYTVSDERIKELIMNQIVKRKPYVLPQDMIFPSSIPSRVIKLNLKRAEILPLQEPTPYGIIELPYPHPPLIEKSTHLEIEFFNHPLFNSEVSVVLDTSAIDISRFPYSSESMFTIRFLKNRRILLPKVVLYELKRRMRKDVERKKVQRALFRLNQFRSMGIISVETTGSSYFLSPNLSKEEKLRKMSPLIEDAKDYRDTLVLISAIENRALLFTNDENLRDMAIAYGIYTIWYNGLEDDIIHCIKTHNFRLTLSKLIKVVKAYSMEVRGEAYKESDIREVVELLKQRGIIREKKGKLGIYG